MLSAILASFLPSAIMASVSTAVTSALTEPFTTSQIARSASNSDWPLLAASEGLVVTPSTRPVAARLAISLGSALSRNNFILNVLLDRRMRARKCSPWKIADEMGQRAKRDFSHSFFGAGRARRGALAAALGGPLRLRCRGPSAARP